MGECRITWLCERGRIGKDCVVLGVEIGMGLRLGFLLLFSFLLMGSDTGLACLLTTVMSLDPGSWIQSSCLHCIGDFSFGLLLLAFSPFISLLIFIRLTFRILTPTLHISQSSVLSGT